MNRRNMIFALASATLIPSTRLLAISDNSLTKTIRGQELASWKAFVNKDPTAWDKIYSDSFFEILSDGSFWSRDDVLGDIEGGDYTATYEIVEDEMVVIGLNETSALIRYKLIATFTPEGSETFLTDAYVVSSYAKISGKWLGCSYQETSLPDPD